MDFTVRRLFNSATPNNLDACIIFFDGWKQTEDKNQLGYSTTECVKYMGRWRKWSDALALEAKFWGFESLSAYNNKNLKILYFQYWGMRVIG